MWRALQFLGLFVGFLLHVSTIKFGSCNASTVGCIERERHALLKFKQGLSDSSNRLSSWVGEDCCGWRGVGCNNQTGNVIKLDLRNRYVVDYNDSDHGWALGGKINPSLLDLKHLNYLDLSLNNFGGISIPKFVGSFKKLRYLNFSNARFGGTIPPQLGNLSRLQYLDLHNYFIGSNYYHIFHFDMFRFSADNLQWLSRLVSLQYLNMGNANLDKATDWMKVINVLSSLSELHLPNCGLNSSSILPSLSSPNFTSLAVLDLSYNSFHGPPLSFGNMTSLVELYLNYNNFKGELPRTLGSLCKLQALDLSDNEFTGEMLEFVESLSGCIRDSLETLRLQSNQLGGYLPDGLGMLKNLKYLHLYGNSFHGLIPTSLGRLTFLKVLDLGFNQLNGTVPESLGQLSELVYLFIDSNSLEGVISEGNFVNLSRLEWLCMSSNSLVLNVSSKWVPPFQVTYLSMSSCTSGPQFPAWLQTQKSIYHLELSNTQIVGTMPNWFWNWSSQIYALYLSHNQINGKLPISFKFNGSIIDLSSNLFDGSLPLFSPNVKALDLSNNSFSGSIPSSIGEMMPELTYLSLSRNLINGSIPASVCKLRNLRILDLKENQLSGQLPQCWRDSPELLVMNLANNDLVGDIPSSIGYLFWLESLHLSNNSLSGELPLTLKNCTRLVTLDLGENKLSGNIPIWIGESLSSLKILRLRSNMFDGDLPSQLSHLGDLQVLELAQNNLSGTIPRSFYNLTAMTTTQKELRPVLPNTTSLYQESVMVAMKGAEFEYKEILSLVTSIDLSCNSLSGEIPEELATLYGLLSLNLSENHLTGKIPQGISGLRWLETLDLSRNLLSGPIPWGMSALTFLNHLNLSYNNFSGKIPSGNQLQTLDDPSIYVSNPKLCGSPLKGKCPGEETSQDLVSSGSAIEDDEEDGDVSETLSFCLAIGLGFSAGFSAFWGVLLLKKSWRYAYFQFFDDMKDRFFFKTVAPKPTRIQNKKFGRNRGSS